MPWRVAQSGPFLDPVFGALGGAAEGAEAGRAGREGDRIILPQAGGDHPAVEIDDALELGALEPDLNSGSPSSRFRLPEIGGRCPSGPAPVADVAAGGGPPLDPVALLEQLGEPRAQLLDLALQDFELLGGGIEGLAAGVP